MRARSILVTGVGGALLSIGLVGPASAAPARSTVRHVIVVATDGRLGSAEVAARRAGGHVTRTFASINGFAVTIDGDRIGDLYASGTVQAVTPDASMQSMAVDPSLGYDPASTTSLSAVSQITGAQAMWNAGYTGKGVDIALIDTGVTPVPGLGGTGKVVNGPDLSFDNMEPTLLSKDGFGHGTHMAGIIAGSDVPTGALTSCTTCLGKSTYTDTTKFEGIAPDARIINVKVGAYDGAADVSQVIAGIDWVVQHRHDAGLNIRVINLSFGTDSIQSAALDPLVYAAETAWLNGIVVVAAAGNDGLHTQTLADPAMSPLVLAVGASNPRGTLDVANDSIPTFAQQGGGARSVDVVAPGVSLISLRVPGGFVDQNVTTGKVGTRFQQATGTSQATAVVTGLVALLLSKFPTATPDQIKTFLKTNAIKVTLNEVNGTLSAIAGNNWYSGAGSANVAPATTIASLPAASTPTRSGSGLGTLEASRGSYHVTNGTVSLNGEIDIFGKPWVAATMAIGTNACATWTGGTWNGTRWTGDAWSGAAWTNATWTANDWSGARWSGARWSAMVWDGARWSGARWSGARWSAGTWSGARWSGARWSDDGWS